MYTAYFDGSCEPINPGGNGRYGFLIKVKGEIIDQASGFIGSGPLISNNLAEYAGLKAILEYFINHGLTDQEIEVYGDSLMVVNQMTHRKGKFHGLYKPFAEDCLLKIQKFKDITLHWIPREENCEADALTR